MDGKRFTKGDFQAGILQAAEGGARWCLELAGAGERPLFDNNCHFCQPEAPLPSLNAINCSLFHLGIEGLSLNGNNCSLYQLEAESTAASVINCSFYQTETVREVGRRGEFQVGRPFGDVAQQRWGFPL